MLKTASQDPVGDLRDYFYITLPLYELIPLFHIRNGMLDP